MKTFKTFALACVAAAALAAPAQAAIVTTSAATVPGVVQTPPFGALPAGGAVGTATIATGLDFTFGNVEGIFQDPPLAFCGINASNICDLLTTVDARIVVLNSLNQGLTSSVSVLAGNAAAGTLTLSVFGIGNTLLASTTNSTAGASSFGITRGTADIAYFAVAGTDTYGVRTISIETPIAFSGAVPEPATWAMMIAGFGVIGASMRRRARTTISFA